MQTIYDEKRQAVTETPLLIFDCTLADGTAERWSTHAVSVDGTEYAARVLQQNVFQMQMASSQGVDGIPGITLTLANADSHFSELEQAKGFKGALLTVAFLFYDLRNGAPATEKQVIFQGICNPPEERREATIRLSAGNRMSLQRLLLPQVRIQRRCPWQFPADEAQRQEAIEGGANGKYSRFYRCGYSAGEAGGSGNLNGAAPYTQCHYVPADCRARGMWLRFGGIEYVPPAIAIRTSGDKNYHTSAISVNQVLYNDCVPMVYGTAWFAPPVVFARNDGNLTRMEVLLGIGEMQGVLTVLVNDVEIPLGAVGTNMTGTGWYNVVSLGARTGTCDPNFTDGSGQAAGDPYGSMAYLSVVVPNRLNDGTALPTVKVLAQGLKVPVYGTDGTAAGEQFSNNPAWVLLDILRRMGWNGAEVDVKSFAAAAAVCGAMVSTLDLNGNAIDVPRFECNLALQSRRSAGDLTRAVRNAARLLLHYGADGRLQCRVENTIAAEQPAAPASSNATQPANDGWPSYEFGDGSSGTSGILRKLTGEPSVRVFSRSIADSPNAYSVEFQDELNDYQQDGYSLVDPEDAARSGQEVSAKLNAVGIANYAQAGRVLQLALDKSIRGNTYIEFDTSVAGFGVRPGDLITFTYQKEGFDRQLFRVLKVAPGTNHRTMTITAQIHDDAWYVDGGGTGSAPGGRRQDAAGAGIPRPLVGSVVDGNGNAQFGIEESDATASDGTMQASVSVSFVASATAGSDIGPGIPLVSLAPTIESGGALAGGQSLYYGFTGVDSGGNEGGMSFLVRAVVETSGSSVTVSGLSFAPGTVAFHVYRGTSAADLLRIATGLALAAQFTDTGLEQQLVAPPDPSFDHANFYWRMELVPEVAATEQSANKIGNTQLQMTENQYRGAVARITRGKGAGQEQTVAANTATTVALASNWVVEPDATSYFTLAESGWKFAAIARSSPVAFAIPNLSGETVQITGRSANANDVECAAEVAPVTRWRIDGAGGKNGDAAVPPAPLFGLGATPGGGSLELTGVSFLNLDNTATISSGTLTLHYRDELAGTAVGLASAMMADGNTVTLSAPAVAETGRFLQIDAEVMQVTGAEDGGLQFTVTRGMHGTAAAAHGAQTAVYLLLDHTAIVPFAPGFFGSPYSGSWSFPIELPDARVASAELFLTNGRGNGPASSITLTDTDELGLRTLAGGQYCIQVPGWLAVEDSAAPPLVIERAHSVRDVYAVMGTAADAPVTLQLNVNGSAYCPVTFVTGQTISNATSGSGLPPLPQGARVTLSVVSVGRVQPGADLTVIIRL